MPYKKGTKNFYAEVDSAINDAFKKQWKKGQVKNDATTAALRIWISIPNSWQAAIMDEPPRDILKFLANKLLETNILTLLDQVEPQERLPLIEKVIADTKAPSEKK